MQCARTQSLNITEKDVEDETIKILNIQDKRNKNKK